MYITCGIRVESRHHVCQDALCQGCFVSNSGEKVWYGAIADGCGSAVGSEFGADFMVKEYEIAVEEFYNNGFRGPVLLDQVALRLAEAMAAYKPKDRNSEIFSYGGNAYSAELFATFYGYIADKERILLLLAGDGYIGINGMFEEVNQGKAATYPIYLLATPRTEWADNIPLIYQRVNMPREQVDSLVLATDGFNSNPLYSDLCCEPLALVAMIEEEASARLYPKHRKDDTTLLALSTAGTKSNNPLPTDAALRIKTDLEMRTWEQIMSHAFEEASTIIRSENRDHARGDLSSRNDLGLDGKQGITLYLMPKEKAVSPVKRTGSKKMEWIGELELLCSRTVRKAWVWLSRKPYDDSEEQTDE